MIQLVHRENIDHKVVELHQLPPVDEDEELLLQVDNNLDILEDIEVDFSDTKVFG